jgi:tRNA threonylcarbamoyladenosine biosynthesis protein TsaB
VNILGIDTSFPADTSIGLSFSVENNLSGLVRTSSRIEIHIRAPLSQEEKLLFAVQSGLEILKKNLSNIDTIAVGIGPGSFTGLRIGIASAKSISWTLKKRIVGISSMELLVNSIPLPLLSGKPLLVPLIDARLGRVFAALFEENKRLTNDYDIDPSGLVSLIKKRKNKRVILFGDGLTKYHQVFSKITGKECSLLPSHMISGITICEMAEKIPTSPEDFDPDRINPVYLRKSEAEINYEKRK